MYKRQLHDTGKQIPVIFISSSKEFVFDAYSAEPVGYILKPVSRQKLAEALTRAIRHLIPKSIIIDTPSRTVSFHIKDITYIEIINKSREFSDFFRILLTFLYFYRFYFPKRIIFLFGLFFASQCNARHGVWF